MPPIPRFECFAVAPPGLETAVRDELREMGIGAEAAEGGAGWEGGWPSLAGANLRLRTASRVLVRLGRFRARALGELERKAAALEWEAYVPPGRGVRLRVSAGRSRIYHEGAAEERIRSALVQRGLPAPPDPEGALFVVRIYRDEVQVSADASGEHLHRRGYRLDVGAAPLRETLAAAALRLCGWTAKQALADPFAGSGTLPIEAALIALKVPPGLAAADREPRAFAFTRWPAAPTGLLSAEADRARSVALDSTPARILASDRDPAAVAALEANARRAGVLEHLEVVRAPLSESPLGRGPGWIVTNPPYGGRLGERRSLRALYRRLGDLVRGPWAGWRLAFFSADRALERVAGLDVEERFRSRNGGIRVRLLVTRETDPQ